MSKKLILIFLISLLLLLGPWFGLGWQDIYYSLTAERISQPFPSFLDVYSQDDRNSVFTVGDRDYLYRDDTLYLVTKDLQVKIGNLKLNPVHQIAQGDLSLNYTFRTEDSLYYISDNTLSRVEDRFVFLTDLGQNPEGFFVRNNILYYAYGWEKRVHKNTLGGPVASKYKRYKYSELDLSTLQFHEISKNKYLLARDTPN